MNKKGFTLIEVIVSFVLVTAISLALFKTVLAMQQRQKVNIALNQFKSFNLMINNEIQYDFLTDKILSTSACGTNCYDITFEKKGTVRITMNKEDGTITYGSFKEKLPVDYTFYDDMTITSYTSSTSGLNSYVVLTIPVKSNYEPNLSNIKYMYQYDSTKTGEVDLNYPSMDDIFANKIGVSGNGELFKDDHNELRYRGSNPDNYVTFNDDVAGWRIVGIFNVDGEQRVKLVRKGSIGNFSWDTSLQSGTGSANNGYGINEWGASETYEGADLMRELNGDYLNSSLTANANWYNGRNNQQTGSFNKNYVLKTSAQELIGEATWYTGGVPGGGTVTLADAYAKERGTQGKMCTSGDYCNDNVERTYTWKGKVGLIYPSDYGYASGNSNCATNISYSNTYCDTNWMSSYGWTITPSPYSIYALNVWYARASSVDYSNALNARAVRPSVYLKPNIKVTGEGTTSNPYVFSLN